MNEISRAVGQKFGLKLILNFPKQGKIEEFEFYGKRDISIIIDLQRKKFPIDRSIIKSKAQEILQQIVDKETDNHPRLKVFAMLNLCELVLDELK